MNEIVQTTNQSITPQGVNLSFLQLLIDSKKLPVHIKTIEDAVTVAQMGKELGFSPMQSFHQIIPISGRLSMSAKAVGAVLRKGGVEFTTKEDGVLLYSNNKTEKASPDDKAIDRRTTIVFKRGSQVEETSFYWTDAVKMGLTEKDNWKKMPKAMLYARCLSTGANRIGQDLLMGLYMTDELFELSPLKEEDVIRDEDGFITEISNKE